MLGFPTLCKELSQLQIQLLQRRTSVQALSNEAVELVHANLSVISVVPENAPFVPLFLRSCASLFQHSTPELTLDSYEVLEAAGALARNYVGSRLGDVNDSSSVLRSVMSLGSSYSDITQREGLPEIGGHNRNPFAGLLEPAFTTAYEKWSQMRTRPTTLSVLSLVSGSSEVFGAGFRFPQVSPDMHGLLPRKSRVFMEAKMQRCYGARTLLKSLHEMEFNRLDAGMCLHTMANCGLYDEEACNKSCSALYSANALLTSQQACETLYNLGVLHHRHVHMRFFASLVNAKKCDANAVLKQAQGLAMLQQPPPQQKALVDGLFLHALRSGHRSGYSGGDGGHRGHSEYALPPIWYIDAAHALTCLGVHNYKFKLMTARQGRRSIAKLSTLERCKFLYGLGGVTADTVPVDLRDSWNAKVEGTKAILVSKLVDIGPKEGPTVVSVLHFSGVTSHPRLPVVQDLGGAPENPIDIILRTWSRVSKERVLELTEQIEPRHARSTTPSQVVQLVERVADSCGPSGQNEAYRFGPLVAAIHATEGSMSVNEVLHTIDGLQRMNLSEHYSDALDSLLENLWSRRLEMSSVELQQCTKAMENLGHADSAVRLLEFSAERQLA